MAVNPHFKSDPAAPSLIFGSQQTPLWTTTLGALIETQALRYGDRIAISFPAQGVRRTYSELLYRSKLVAKAILSTGIEPGKCVGIFAHNCYEYLEVFLGAGRIRCPVVVFNATYTPNELLNAIAASECTLVFATHMIGPKRDISQHLDMIDSSANTVQSLVMFSGDHQGGLHVPVHSYAKFIAAREHHSITDFELVKVESNTRANDLLNLQFTSGTTGSPKAAMLSHMNLINNAQLLARQMRLTTEDVVCCPPPLYHCFGLVMGFLTSFTSGSSIVFPSPVFDAGMALDAIEAESCTVLLGVPTMFFAQLDENKTRGRKMTTLRTGFAAGAPVPKSLMRRIEDEMGIRGMLIAYGMTETGPVTFATSLDDSEERRLYTVGNVLAHTGAKIVDKKGSIVPRGVRGEICTSGYGLQRGYWKNEAKTKETMRADHNGILWMHTGDEGSIDSEGYCKITGRIKDLIIRGGENIFPTEIEERLLAHPTVTEACVVGLPDEKYGEAVSCFLREDKTRERSTAGEIADWVRQSLGRQKAPKHVFWIGDSGVGEDFPKTGSGKHQKHILRDIGARLLLASAPRARL